MTALPTRQRVRRTRGSKTLAKFIDRHGLRPVSVYFPEALHRALAGTAIEADTSLQALVTLACHSYFGVESPLPPLVQPTRTHQDPHKSFTWYADIDLHRTMKIKAIDVGSTVQQLILSAVVSYMRKAPRVKALNIPTGFPAFARAPGSLPH